MSELHNSADQGDQDAPQQKTEIELSLTGTANLIEDIDKRLLVVLRDGRTLIGYLRSVDQFANLVLHQAVERIYVGQKFGDIDRGIYIIRGENVVLLGEMMSPEEAAAAETAAFAQQNGKKAPKFEEVSVAEILELQRQDILERSLATENRKRFLKQHGLYQPYEHFQEEFFNN